MNITKIKVQNKLSEIIPKPHRIKRGLIDGLGSIFKSITGNLDASDGERYNNIINQIENNQEKIASNIATQNSVSIDIINQFNKTVQQICHNEDVLMQRIKHIAEFVEQNSRRENINFIKDTLNQIINMYEIINSILQDIENSISFSKLKIMHPSIIKTTDFYKELLKLKGKIETDKLPFEITLENTLLMENIINIECYILNNKITYLLHLPIMYPIQFNYYHLYSIPIFDQGQFKTIIPNKKYLLKGKSYFTYESDICTKIRPNYYICKKLNIEEIRGNSPCAIQLLELKNTSNCQQTIIKLTKPIIKQLDETTKWISIFPNTETVKLKCLEEEEILNIIGTYLIDIPIGCELITSQEKIVNEEQFTKNQPILFPEINENKIFTPKQDFSIQLENIELDELQFIKRQVIANQPQLIYHGVSHTPSLWTMILYIIAIVSVIYFCFKKFIFPRLCTNPNNTTNPEPILLPNVQLPRCSP